MRKAHWMAAVLAAGVLACSPAPDSSSPGQDASAWNDPWGEGGTETTADAPGAEVAADSSVRPADAPRGEAGAFDYYILSLSWSPSFCATPAGRSEPLQCAGERPFSFIVHGLWPQYERGYPQNCPSDGPADAPASVERAMLDLMPSPDLIQHEWDRHGVCHGGPPEAYFQETRRLRERVRIPAEFERLSAPREVTAQEVEAAFVSANRGLTPDAMVVTCNRDRLREVRICFDKAGGFRACGADVRERCGDRPLTMPPVR
jgi:ribonuclease T2